ncbi:unnamed protein product [Camellia sinensis]
MERLLERFLGNVSPDVKDCDICGDAGREDFLATCSKCSDGAEHTYCMGVRMEKVPEGNWITRVELDAKGSDVEKSRRDKVGSISRICAKRPAGNLEFDSITKRRALETMSKSGIVESLLSWADSGIVVEEHRQGIERLIQGIERLRKEIDELVSLRKLVKAPDDLSDKCMNDVSAKVKGGFPARKSSAAEERRLADIERKKVEENLIQLEKLKREADDARSKLVLETFKSEEANKKIEAKKKKVITEKKRADSEMAKAKELRKFAEINQKKVMDEKCHADYLSQQVEEHRQRIERLQRDTDELVPLRKFVEAPDKCMNAEAAEVKGGLRTEILEREADESKLVLEYLKSEQHADSETRKAEEQRKVAETNKKAAMEERHRANQLAQQLEDNKRRIEELQKEILELVSSRTLVEAPAVLPDKNMNSETAIMKLQRKKLKFKKKQVKHAKKVAEFEIYRNNILQQELCCLRQGFVQFSHRLDVLNNYFSQQGEGSDDLYWQRL